MGAPPISSIVYVRVKGVPAGSSAHSGIEKDLKLEPIEYSIKGIGYGTILNI